MTNTARITPMGLTGLLLDAAGPTFDDRVQNRVHAVARQLRELPTVRDVVPGMNNLLVDVGKDTAVDEICSLLARLWAEASDEAAPGRTVEIPVTYGGEDFAEWVAGSGLTAEQATELHAGAIYRVAAIGAMPGFVYLSGLDPKLARPRRKVPRPVVPCGAVIIGGAQAGIMPITAPSGWHIIGHTDATLFDPQGATPFLFQAGDLVRFVNQSVTA